METLEQIKAYLDQRGKEYIPALLPKDLQRMRLHHCFVNTEDVVMWWKETEYAGILANSWRFPLLAIQIL